MLVCRNVTDMLTKIPVLAIFLGCFPSGPSRYHGLQPRPHTLALISVNTCDCVFEFNGMVHKIPMFEMLAQSILGTPPVQIDNRILVNFVFQTRYESLSTPVRDGHGP